MKLFKKFKKAGALLMALTLGLSLASCSQGGGEEVVLASANPMTGDSAQFGDMKVKAMNLAIDEVNAKGGINGKKVRLIVEDDTGNPKEAPNVAQKITSNDSILGIIGHWNTACTLAARGIYESAGIPVITDIVNKAISDGTTPHVYRISLSDKEQAVQLAQHSYNVLGKRKVAIMHSANDYGTNLTSEFKKEFEKLGGKVVATEMYFEGQSKDFSPQITKIKGESPDLLFVAGYYVETALIAQQSKSLGLEVQMLGTEGISSDELIKLGGKSVEGIVFAGFFHPDVEFSGTKEFVKAFKDKYQKDPDTYAALAYDSAKLFIKAIEEKGEDRAAIKGYLDSVKEYQGVAGPITFKNNEVERKILILTVKDGKIVPAEKVGK
ncbi:MAG: ABC transporter substrate-binding protein [Clostridium sp.]